MEIIITLECVGNKKIIESHEEDIIIEFETVNGMTHLYTNVQIGLE